MPVGLLGRKVGMTQVYDTEGNIVPVTAVECGPCVVLQLRSADRDGYQAVQLGFQDKPRRSASRSERGQVANITSKRQRQLTAAGVEPIKKADTEPKRFVREFRTDGEENGHEVGQVLTVAALADVPRVDVIGTSKGRGTAGAMKRHNFSGQPASHGAKKVHRALGGTGANATNRGLSGKIKKGKRMPGRYGHGQVTVRNLRVVRVDEANNLLLIEGAIPGPNGGYVVVRHTNRLRRKSSH